MNLRSHSLSKPFLALLAAASTGATLPDYPDDVNHGIPVNYTEANVGEYTLPDPLRMENGDPVASVHDWRHHRRPELRSIFEHNQYGVAPGKPEGMRFEVVEAATPALDGAALRKQIVIRFGDEENAPWVDLLVYVPADQEGPRPLLLSISFMPNNMTVDDPAVRVGRRWDREARQRVPATGPSRFGRVPVREIIEQGFGVATICYSDIEVDAPNAIDHGVRGHFLPEGQTELTDDAWGAIAAWAWGISRVIDYFETDPLVDQHRVAITGISRLGKTVMWAGANDERIAAVIASCSGEGGAALSRRNYGETIAHLASPERYAYQFARNYQAWGPDPNQAPVDAHELIALMAPRPVLLQTGTTDKWSDPVGEFLAAKGATPVYDLLGKSGVRVEELPDPDQQVGGDLTYFMHEGGHGMVPGDWPIIYAFLKKHLHE